MSHDLSDLRAALPALVDEARRRSLEFEEGRCISPDFGERLRAAGLFRLLVPQSMGGLGATLNEWLEVGMALAEADASTAWVSTHAAACSGLIHAIATPQFKQEFFADPGACAAWSNLPRVKAVEEADGLRLSGSWGFASGCTLATHVGGMVVLPAQTEGGPPRLTVALAPVAQARIVTTWDPVGLAGSGSHELHFDDLLVPWHRTFAWPISTSNCDYPAAAFAPGPWFISVCAAATHLGLARRALDESRRELQGKTDRATGKPLLDHPSTQRSLEAAEGLWFALRAGLREALAAIWASAVAGQAPSAEARVNARVAAVTAVHQGTQVVRAAFDVAGASAVHRGGVLQRLLRESSCLIHHVSSNLVSYERTGRVRCGLEPLDFKV